VGQEHGGRKKGNANTNMVTETVYPIENGNGETNVQFPNSWDGTVILHLEYLQSSRSKDDERPSRKDYRSLPPRNGYNSPPHRCEEMIGERESWNVKNRMMVVEGMEDIMTIGDISMRDR
jgi:hypothetical protein